MQPKSSAEKELMKENLYLNRVQEVLRKNKDFVQAAYYQSSEGPKDDSGPSPIKNRYAAERSIIDRVMTNETTAFLSGIALSGLVFASVRFGPRWLTVKINPEKAKLLKEADEIAEKANTRWMQKIFGFVFESSFAAWAGWRGYCIMSSQNKSSYEEIARIPLCAGRSTVSEKVCPDWVNLVHKEIPPAFWKNLDDGDDCRLKDPQRWRAVRAFADNCIKRRVFEDSYRKQHGLNPGTAVDVPEGGVPDDILLSLNKKSSG